MPAGLLHVSSWGGQVQGSQWAPHNLHYPFSVLLTLFFFALVTLFSAQSSPEWTTPTPSFCPHWSQLFYIHNQVWYVLYWYPVTLAWYSIIDTFTEAQLAFQYYSEALQYFPSTKHEIWSSLTPLPLTCVWKIWLFLAISVETFTHFSLSYLSRPGVSSVLSSSFILSLRPGPRPAA